MKIYTFLLTFAFLTACNRCNSEHHQKPEIELETRADDHWLRLSAEHEMSLESIPKLLSETGIFKDVSQLILREEFIPYELNIPFWSDSAEKFRWFYLPEGQKIKFSSNDYWSFPQGTVFVKHFAIDLDETADNELTHLETRILMSSERGWLAYAYKWNDDQDDAELSLFWTSKKFEKKTADGSSKTLEWVFPGREDCFTCHGVLAPKILGAKTAQFNRLIKRDGKEYEQLEDFLKRGILSAEELDVQTLPKFPELDNKKFPLSQRARAYLDVNCANCHYDGGMADFDLSYEADISKVIDKDPDADQEEFVVADAKLIITGNKEKSLVWLRMGLTDYHRMPPISSNVVDEAGMALIGEWIDKGAK